VDEEEKVPLEFGKRHSLDHYQGWPANKPLDSSPMAEKEFFSSDFKPNRPGEIRSLSKKRMPTVMPFSLAGDEYDSVERGEGAGRPKTK